MTDWLFDTFVWTAALIALVLVIRRPVGRFFGAGTAYYLWALPMMRLLMPAIELPAWMNPDAATHAAAGTDGGYLIVIDRAPEPASWIDTLPLTEMALVAWLGGAAVFLFLRFRAYHLVREELLADARGVGQAGKVRLIETPATQSPLALGVCDKIVALPKGFMARYDREARDLALAHELAHHRGHDLLVNMLVQPLFALHWFNPLGRIGWLAMRRDQEAACDARVVRAHGPAQRATYANLIASFAAGPKVALAAPMACPVLGDKSIIQRLRSLKMNEFSRRRRLAGRGLLAAALIALPLTASISYAEPAAPTPPVAPGAPAAPAAPLAPAAPAAPVAPHAVAEIEATEAGEQVFVWHDEGGATSDGNVHKVHKVKIVRDGKELTDEEREEMMRELREEMADMERGLAQAKREMHIAMVDLNHAKAGATVVKIRCNDGEDGVELHSADGKTERVCTSEIMASALSGLEQARASIAREKGMSEEIRKDVLRELDREIARMKKEKEG